MLNILLLNGINAGWKLQFDWHKTIKDNTQIFKNRIFIHTYPDQVSYLPNRKLGKP